MGFPQEFSNLSYRQPVAERDFRIADKRKKGWIDHRAVEINRRDGIGPVEHPERYSLLSARFHAELERP
jgi:hypothetical protein